MNSMRGTANVLKHVAGVPFALGDGWSFNLLQQVSAIRREFIRARSRSCA
jgi:hypothetical protein